MRWGRRRVDGSPWRWMRRRWVGCGVTSFHAACDDNGRCCQVSRDICGRTVGVGRGNRTCSQSSISDNRGSAVVPSALYHPMLAQRFLTQ